MCVSFFLLISQRGLLTSPVCLQQKMKRSCVLMTGLEGTELLGAVISTSETYIKDNSPPTLNLKHCYCQHFPAPTNYRNCKETVGHVRGSEAHLQKHVTFSINSLAVAEFVCVRLPVLMNLKDTVCLSALFIKKSGATRAFCFSAGQKKEKKSAEMGYIDRQQRGVRTITMN